MVVFLELSVSWIGRHLGKFISLNITYTNHSLFSHTSGIEFKSQLLTDRGHSCPLQVMSHIKVFSFI